MVTWESFKESSASVCRMCGMILERCNPDQEEFYIDLTGKADGGLCMRVMDSLAGDARAPPAGS